MSFENFQIKDNETNDFLIIKRGFVKNLSSTSSKFK